MDSKFLTPSEVFEKLKKDEIEIEFPIMSLVKVEKKQV